MSPKRLGAAIAVAAALSAVVAPSASALSLFTPKKAEKASSMLVVAYNECTTPNINDPALGVGNNACAAVQRNPNFKFGPKGQATYSTAFAKVGKKVTAPGMTDLIPDDASDNISNRRNNPTGDIVVKAKLTDGHVNDGSQTPLSQDITARSGYTLIDDLCDGPDDCFVAGESGSFRLSKYAGSNAPYPVHPGASDPTCSATGTCQLTTTYNIAASNIAQTFLGSFVYSGVDANNLVQQGHAQTFEAHTPCIGPDGATVGTPPSPSLYYDSAACQGLLLGKKSGSEPSDFGHPAKANKMQAEYVMHVDPFFPCFSYPNHALPVMSSGCNPPIPNGALQFAGDGFGHGDGGGSLKLIAAQNKIKVIGKLTGLNPVGLPTNVSVRLPARITYAGCNGGTATCTRPDQMLIAPGTCSATGSCKVNATLDLGVPTDKLSNVQIGSPDESFDIPACFWDGAEGDPFARPSVCPGTFVP